VKTKNNKKMPKKEAKTTTDRAAKADEPAILKEAALAYEVDEVDQAPMVRTQIYLSKPEHQFVQNESDRQGRPMAAIIRALIDEKMEIPDSAWTNNPLLAAPADPIFIGPEDGVINDDHYIYGGPKKWIKHNGKWVEAPPLPEDYYTDPASAAAYDRKLEGKG
jgi:hypothetical protein